MSTFNIGDEVAVQGREGKHVVRGKISINGSLRAVKVQDDAGNAIDAGVLFNTRLECLSHWSKSKFEIGDEVAVEGRDGKHVVVSYRGNRFWVKDHIGALHGVCSEQVSALAPPTPEMPQKPKFRVNVNVVTKGGTTVFKIKHICEGVAMLKTVTGSFSTASVSDLQLAPKVIDCASVDLPKIVKTKASQFDNCVLELFFESKEARDLALKNL